MVKGLTNRPILDRLDALELALHLRSFSGGENTIGADHELKSNEARRIKNWEATSLGSMKRARGFNEIADGGATYSEDVDLLIQHFEGSNTEIYGVIEGDLFIISGSDINQEDAAKFTSGVLSHGVSAGDALWITNSTDNIIRKTIGNAAAAPSGTPSEARERIFEHKSRLFVEGGGKTVYSSRAGTGNWTAADAWSASGDAANIDLPDVTRGSVPYWPGGGDITVFTKFGAYRVFNFPNVAFQKIPNSRGSSAPYAVALGNEGVFLVSEFPTKGVFLWDGVNWIDLTEFNDFIDDVNFNQRIFGIYRNNKYHLFYNESASGVNYPNRWRIYQTEFGRWMEREINSDLSDTFGYPTLLTRSSNELYVGSAQKDKVYELETTDNDDEGNDTQSDYLTKDFSSRDFAGSAGGSFGIDNVRLKLLKAVVTFSGTVGTLVLGWSADGGGNSGSLTFDLTAEGDKLNSTFVLNTSKLASTSEKRTKAKTFNNSAVGRKFNFQLLNNGQSTRPEIFKIKIIAIAMEEL